MSGSAIAQVLSFLFMPVLTRLYTPESFGEFGVFASLSSIVVQVAAFAYPFAIVLPKLERDAYRLAYLSLFIGILSSIAFLIISVILNVFVSESVNLKYSMLISVSMFLGVVLAILSQWAVRKNLFKVKALSLTVNSLFVNMIKVVFGCFIPSALVLMLSTMFGVLIQSIILGKEIFKSVKSEEKIFAKKETKYLKNIAWMYKDFPFFRAPEIGLGAISQGMPVMLFASFYGPAVAGYYTLAISVVSAPTLLVGKSISDVLYSLFARIHNRKGKLSTQILRQTIILMLLSAPFYVLFAVYSTDIFSVVFGDQWSESGEYGSWVALWMLAFLINRPASTIYPILGCQKYLLYFQIVSLFLRFSGLSVGFYYYNNATISIFLFCMSSVIINVMMIITIYRISINKYSLSD